MSWRARAGQRSRGRRALRDDRRGHLHAGTLSAGGCATVVCVSSDQRSRTQHRRRPLEGCAKRNTYEGWYMAEVVKEPVVGDTPEDRRSVGRSHYLLWSLAAMAGSALVVTSAVQNVDE